MTGSPHPTIPQDLAIQVAENEGMPSRPTAGGAPPPAARPRRLAGTLSLGLSPSRAAGEGHQPAGAMRTRRPLAGPVAMIAVMVGAIATMAFPALAQDGTGPVPDNAEARSYGPGWDCAFGYQVDGVACIAVAVPENAHATGRSYGSGWACRRGFEEVGGASCKAIPVPEDAFLRSSGYDWQCDRGYRQERETCVPVVLPENAYLTDDALGAGWACARGYTAGSSACLPIVVPENGYLTNADYGAEWVCERGFFEVDGRCDPVALPANAYMDESLHGPGWRCDRGFEAVDRACVAIALPEDAHLDRSGNRWRCNAGFQLSAGECVLGR